MFTREQVKAARVLRGWGVRQLAKVAGVGYTTLSRFENGSDSRGETLRRLQGALEREGFEFASSGCGISWDPEAPGRWRRAGDGGTES